MPWRKKGSFNKHVKNIKSQKAREAARKAANAALGRGLSEVSAIRIGKSVARRIVMKRRTS